MTHSSETGNSSPNTSSEILWRRIFYGMAILTLIIMPLLSFDFGITWDERMQGHYGKLILRYILTGGHNHDFMDFAETTYLYGGFFDTLTGFIYAVLFESPHQFAFSGLNDTVKGISGQDVHLSGFYETRHVMNALFGFVAMFYTGLLAKLLKSWRSACLAFLLILLSPRFFGDSMNNPKDIPFAMAYVFSLHSMILFLKELPKPKKSTITLLAVGIATAIGVRIGGLILIFYFFIFTGCQWLFLKNSKMPVPHPAPLLGKLFLIAVLGYLGGLLFWPYGQMNPMLNPLLTFKTFSNFTGAASPLLFEAKTYSSASLPWYYIPKWLGISNPLTVLVGVLSAFLLLRPLSQPLKFYGVLFTAFAFLFPIISVMIKRPILYDGWRHLLFVYPPMVVLAALAWDKIFEQSKNSSLRLGVLAAFVCLGFQPLVWMIKNHPHESVYFNPLVGGIDGAQGRYQTDYWGNSLRGCAEWLGNHLKAQNQDRVYIIHSDGNSMSSFPYLHKILGQNYLPYKYVPSRIKKLRNPDYGIFISKPLGRDAFLGNAWPPPGTIYTVNADNTALCAVVQNTETT